MHLARIAAKLFLLARVQVLRLPICTSAKRHAADCQTVGFKKQAHPIGTSTIKTEGDCSEHCRKDLGRLKNKLVRKTRIGFPMRIGVKWDNPTYYAIDECSIHTRFCIHPWKEFASRVHNQHCPAKTAPRNGRCQGPLCSNFRSSLRGGCMPPSIPEGLGYLCHCEYLLALPKIKRTKSILSRHRLLEFKKDFSCDHEPVCVRLNGHLNVGIDGWTCNESEALLTAQPCYDEGPAIGRKDIASPLFPYVFSYTPSVSKQGSVRDQCDDWSQSPGAAKLLAGRELSPSAWISHDELCDNDRAFPPLDTDTGNFLWNNIFEASANLDSVLAEQLFPAVDRSSRPNPFVASTPSEHSSRHQSGSLTAGSTWQSNREYGAIDLVAHNYAQDQHHMQLLSQEDDSQQYRSQVTGPMQLNLGQLSALLELDQRNELSRELVMTLTLDLDEMTSIPDESSVSVHNQSQLNQDLDWTPSVQCRSETPLKKS